MIINTMAEGITLAKSLETDSGIFYKALAEKYPAQSEKILAWAKENEKFITQIERAYYGVISDAIEGCFALNLETEKYTLNKFPIESKSYNDALDHAIKIENVIISYYENAAEQSKALMADVPRMFIIIARKRKARVEEILALK